MIPTPRGRAVLIAGALAVAVMTPAAGAQARTTIRDCGDTANGGAYAITGQGVSCTSSRAVARIVAQKASCRPNKGGCSVRGFTCLVGQAGKELFLAHCENSDQTRFVRFEYGS